MPNLATMTAPLHSLLGKNSSWLWGEPQETAFNQIKQLLTSTEILAQYDLAKDTIIAADASNDGIGAVLLQKQEDGSRRPVCFIWRSLSDAEKHYAVIEKEALVVTWASERLEEYILGIHYTIETDHKALVPPSQHKGHSQDAASHSEISPQTDALQLQCKTYRGQNSNYCRCTVSSTCFGTRESSHQSFDRHFSTCREMHCNTPGIKQENSRN